MPLKSSLSVDRKIDFRERRNIPFLPQFVTSRKQSKMGRLQDGAKFAVSWHVMSARKEFEKWSAQQFQTYMTYLSAYKPSKYLYLQQYSWKWEEP